MTETRVSALLDDGETLIKTFTADRGTYVRANTWLAAAAMAGGMAVLWLLGNPYVWTGAIGGLAAVLVRAWYLMSEELSHEWHLTDRRLIGPHQRRARLCEITAINTLGNTVQIVTSSGDKHLIKYLKNRDDTVAVIDRARSGGRA